MKDFPKPMQDQQIFIEQFWIIWVHMTQDYLIYINLYICCSEPQMLNSGWQKLFGPIWRGIWPLCTENHRVKKRPENRSKSPEATPKTFSIKVNWYVIWSCKQIKSWNYRRFWDKQKDTSNNTSPLSHFIFPQPLLQSKHSTREVGISNKSQISPYLLVLNYNPWILEKAFLPALWYHPYKFIRKRYTL